MRITLFIIVGLLVYIYFGYPLFLLMLARFFKDDEEGRGNNYLSANLPSVSLIIAAYNEEKIIEEKIRNSIDLDYPRGLFEIVIVSDGSNDETNNIIAHYAERYDVINFIKYFPRRGKANALNQGVLNSKGDILLFSDANVMYDKKAIKEITSKFVDCKIGGVCGKVLLYSSISKEVCGEGLYMKYERFIFKYESRIKTMIGTDGAMYAIRRELYLPLPPSTILDDFVTAMRIAGSGFRVIYDEHAKGYEEAASSIEKEFKRKVRIFAGGFQAFSILLSVLNPVRDPFLVFAFVSHKLLRWLSPFLLIVVLICNMSLLEYPFYLCIFLFQIFFYGCSLIGYFFPKSRKMPIIYFPLYFTTVNIAALLGFFKFIFGLQKVTWGKSRD